ncbi:MAG: hypothetical protein H6739_42495 [Alphaproteobacteria bacterium]|nr:hypothetical protein [Alphaproteobacteria bacterium]
MWLRVEAAVECGTCAGSTPVNAAVDAQPCDTCGVAIPIRVWAGAFEELSEAAEEMVDQEQRALRWSLGSGTLRITLTRTPPACPHCAAPWGEAAEHCPRCALEVSLRRRHGLRLLGEDRAALDGERPGVQVETLRCPSCAAPIAVDGRARTLRCGSCEGQVVLPDEVWRRVHAPTQVAPWFVEVAGGGRGAALPEGFDFDDAVGVGSRIVGVGVLGEEYALVMLETRPPGLVWSALLGEPDFTPRVAVCRDEVLLAGEMSTRVRRFALADGAPRGQLHLPEEVQDLAVDPDGTWVVHTHPLGALRRFDTDGALRWLWTEPGFFGRLFGGGRPRLDHAVPEERPSAGMTAAMPGRLAMGLDGDLRVVAARYVARLKRDGRLVWCVDAGEAFSGGGVSIVRPGAGPDGTTWAVMVGALQGDETQEGRAVLVRIPGEGGSVRAILLGELYPCALAVTEDGHVWLSHGEGLSRYDGEGNLIWRSAGG